MKDDARTAAFTLLTSSVLFGLMAVAARVASATIPAPQVVLVRFALGVVAVALAACVALLRRHPLRRPTRWRWLLARGLFGGMAVYLYFTCIQRVGVGVATLLNYTAPVWAMLLGWWLLRERPRAVAVAALGVTLVGVALVVIGGGARLGVGRWALLGVLSAVFSGVAVTSIRAVRRRSPDGAPGEGSWTVFASFTTIGALTALPGVIGPLGQWVTPTAGQWSILIAVGVLSVVAQLLMTSALEHVTATTSGIIHQLTVVISMTAGILFFGERLTALSLLGSAVTVAGVLWTVRIAAPARIPLPPAGG